MLLIVVLPVSKVDTTVFYFADAAHTLSNTHAYGRLWSVHRVGRVRCKQYSSHPSSTISSTWYDRMLACQKIMDNMLEKIERSAEIDRRKEEKLQARLQKAERVKTNRLEALLFKRKEILKRQMERKRSLLEKDLSLEIQKSLPTVKRKQEKAAQEGPKPKKRKSEEQRIVCICRRPFDDTR